MNFALPSIFPDQPVFTMRAYNYFTHLSANDIDGFKSNKSSQNLAKKINLEIAGINIPQDLFILIFKFLDKPQSLSNSRLVCKKFYQIITSSFYFENARLPNISVKYIDLTASINIRFDEEISSKWFFLKSYLPFIQKFNIENLKITKKELAAFKAYCVFLLTHLTEMQLKKYKNDFEQFALTITKIEKFCDLHIG